MEFVIDENVNLLDFYGNISLIDSFDILSVCSDVLIDDLEFNGRMVEIGEEDDNLLNNKCDDDGLEVKGVLYRKFMKQWSENILLEGMFILVVVVVKKFILECQKGNFKLRRFYFVDSVGGERWEDFFGVNSSSEL